MKKFNIVAIITIMALGITGCSNVKKIEPRYGLVEEAVYTEKTLISFTDILKEANVTVEKSDNETSEFISNLEIELVDFINDKYDLNWTTSEVEVYELNFSDVEGYGIYNAMADPENNDLFLNTAVGDIEQDNVKVFSVHELIHCLTFKNLGTYKFVLTDSEGNELGYYTSEAFTDFLTIKFFESKGMPEVKEFLYSNSGYCYTTCALDMLESSIPNEMYYYLTNDINSLEKEFNELSDKYMKIPSELEDNAFESFLYRADIMQAVTLTLIQGGYSQNLANMWIQSIFGNFEEVVIISRGQPTDVQQENYDKCYELFNSEGEITGSLNEFLEYLKSCIR